MKLKPIPRSKAKTAWGLLQDVKRAMLEEPKRVIMRGYIENRPPQDGGPGCGTVGCIAGWACLLGGVRADNFDCEDKAIGLLGDDMKYQLYRGPWGKEHLFSPDGYDIAGLGEQTPRFARKVVARINKFMRVNEKALKAKRI